MNKSYRLCSSSLIHAPGMFRYSQQMTATTLNKEGRDAAARLYFLAATFPQLPADVLLDIANESEQWQIDINDEDATVILTPVEK